LALASRGLSIFPLAPGAKTPLGEAAPHGCHDSTTDSSHIEQWWANHPNANVGVATGDGLIVIDLDVDPDRELDGLTELARLETEVEELPHTATVRTPRGGKHLYFRLPDGVTIRNSAGKLAAGIDVRGEGGYVVAPPSTREDGARWTWESAQENGIAELPKTWIDMLTKPPRERCETGPVRLADGSTTPWGRARLDAVVDAVGASSEGSRNHKLNVAAFKVGQAVASGHIDEEEGRAELFAAAVAAGLGEREASKTVESGIRAGEREPVGPATSHERREFGERPPPPTDDDAPGHEQWRDHLTLTAKGKIKPVLGNAMLLVRHHPGLRDKLALDVRSMRPVWRSAPPWKRAMKRREDLYLTDSDAAECALWLQVQTRVSFAREPLQDAMITEAHRNPFDAVRVWLESLKWDGIERIDHWLHKYLGVDDGDYTTKVGAAWLISAVARTYDPGCQADYMIVLEGSQGSKKTSALRTLAGAQWYAEISITDSKDSILAVHGPWIVEWGELSGMRKGEIEYIKGYISRRVDHVRRPYGKAHTDMLRRCVFSGSTNDSQWLTDPTGGRRFWPVRVRRIANLALIKGMRDQLWAEAVHRYNGGGISGMSYLDQYHEPLAVLEQADRYAGDPWEDAIEEELTDGKLMSRTSVTMHDVLDAIGVYTTQQSTAAGRRVAQIMQRIGWTRGRLGRGVRRRTYLRPVEQEIQTTIYEDEEEV
jgi:predicted P-loop ATPase